MTNKRSPEKVNLVLASLAAMVLLYVLFHQLTLKNSPSIKIGVLHSLTGTMALSESPLVDAVRLAVEVVNKAGGVNGAFLEMVVADCRSDADYCAQQAEKLITQDKVLALFGCWTSACRQAVKPVVEKHHHLLFYPLQSEGLEKSPDIFYTGAAPNQQIIPMVNWAMQQRGKRVYLIGSDYVFPRIANKIVKKLLQAQDGIVLAERYVALGDDHLDLIAKEISSLHPDFVLNTLNGSSNQYFFRSLQKAGVLPDRIPVFSTSIAEAELAVIGPKLMAGHYAAWNYFQSIASTENTAFINLFHHRFGQGRVLNDPMEASYIGVNLFVNALRSSNTLELPVVKMALEQQTLNAPEGIVAVDSDTHHLWKSARIGKATVDGQFKIVWQSGYSLAPASFPFFIPFSEHAALSEGVP